MSLPALAINRRVTFLMVFLLMTGAGVFGITQLGLDYLPKADLGQVMIITALPLLIILLQTVSVYYQLPQWMMSVAFWYNRAADYVNNCGFLFAICLCQFLLCRRQKTTSAK